MSGEHRLLAQFAVETRLESVVSELQTVVANQKEDGRENEDMAAALNHAIEALRRIRIYVAGIAI